MNDPKNIKRMKQAIDQYRKKNEPPPDMNPSLVQRAKRRAEQKALEGAVPPSTTAPAPPNPGIGKAMREATRIAAEAATKNLPSGQATGTGRISLGEQQLSSNKMPPKMQRATINRESMINAQQLLEMRKQRKMMQK